MIPIECQFDDNGLLYIDNYSLKNMINYGKRGVYNQSFFFKINSTDEYIIKYYQKKLNKKEVLTMLLKFYNVKGNNISNIDFPIGYYMDNNQIKGLIIPNYQHAISIKEALLNNNLNDYYNKSDNLKDNLSKLLYDIFKILENLYNQGIIYTDVNSGNFLLNNNEVKIIDFDPKYIFYQDQDKFYLDKMLFNYRMLYNLINKKYNINLMNNKEDILKKIKKGK